MQRAAPASQGRTQEATARGSTLTRPSLTITSLQWEHKQPVLLLGEAVQSARRGVHTDPTSCALLLALGAWKGCCGLGSLGCFPESLSFCTMGCSQSDCFPQRLLSLADNPVLLEGVSIFPSHPPHWHFTNKQFHTQAVSRSG